MKTPLKHRNLPSLLLQARESRAANGDAIQARYQAVVLPHLYAVRKTVAVQLGVRGLYVIHDPGAVLAVSGLLAAGGNNGGKIAVDP